MQIFNQDAGKYMAQFSSEFKDSFLKLLATRHSTNRVSAHTVYQEYIADRYHVHLNATCWGSLTAFVKHLGKESHCKVEETEEGWFLTYIDRDPEAVRRQNLDRRRLKNEKDELFIERELLDEQIKRANEEIVEVQSVFPKTTISLVEPFKKKRKHFSELMAELPETKQIEQKKEPKSCLEILVSQKKERDQRRDYKRRRRN